MKRERESTMLTNPVKYKILILIRDQWFSSYAEYAADQEKLTNLMNGAISAKVYTYAINSQQSSDFVWGTVFNIEFASSIDISEIHSISEIVINQFQYLYRHILKGDQFIALLTKARSFGQHKNNTSVIMSLYKWNQDINEIERNTNMLTHFEMEKEQQLYSFVQFNSVIRNLGSEILDIDFIFEGELPEPESITKLYSSSFLPLMREHSKSFLDTDTRKLAFGSVYTISKEGINER